MLCTFYMVKILKVLLAKIFKNVIDKLQFFLY